MMRRLAPVAAAAALLVLSAPLVNARQQDPVKPKAPRLTTEEVQPGRPEPSPVDSEIKLADTKTAAGVPRAATASNARAVLENSLTQLATAKSLRMRIQIAQSGKIATDAVVESVKPDRVHLINAESELIVIGRNSYVRLAGGGWQTIATQPGVQASLGVDATQLIRQVFDRPGVTITGRLVGQETIEGTETRVYEFTMSERGKSGAIQACIGKEDGFLRRLVISGDGLEIKLWIKGFNEGISIDPPSM